MAVHFVLELIQNADDNTYAPGVTPTLRIRASIEQLDFYNNELGFSEKNVFALCSMGESTKKASDAGYIGNKVRVREREREPRVCAHASVHHPFAISHDDTLCNAWL